MARGGAEYMTGQLDFLTAFSMVIALVWSGSETGVPGTMELDQVAMIPEGSPILVDGILDREEWAEAATEPFAGAGRLHFLTAGRYLQIGVDGGAPGFPHLAVAGTDTVWILHASASLGSITYVREGDGWHRSHGPAWALQDPSLTPRARGEREEYLRLHGWVASTIRMGEVGRAEFVLDLRRFGPTSIRLSAVFLALEPEEAIHRWPSAGSDDVAARLLLTGPMPEILHFRPSAWRLLSTARDEPGPGPRLPRLLAVAAADDSPDPVPTHAGPGAAGEQGEEVAPASYRSRTFTSR
jgi:hypothetical protein